MESKAAVEVLAAAASPSLSEVLHGICQTLFSDSVLYEVPSEFLLLTALK